MIVKKIKKMKKLNSLIIVILALIICACSGSETYRGKWQALDNEGAKYEFFF